MVGFTPPNHPRRDFGHKAISREETFRIEFGAFLLRHPSLLDEGEKEKDKRDLPAKAPETPLAYPPRIEEEDETANQESETPG
jgi:hypothetical protein